MGIPYVKYSGVGRNDNTALVWADQARRCTSSGHLRSKATLHPMSGAAGYKTPGIVTLLGSRLGGCYGQ